MVSQESEVVDRLRTDHLPLLLDDSTQVPKDLMQFMNAGLNLPNLGFTLLDESFLVGKFSRRQLCLKELSLALFDSAVVLGPVSRVVNIRTSKDEKVRRSVTYSPCSSSTAIFTPSTTVRWRSAETCCAR